MIVPFRYGVEAEGRFKGALTLIMPSVQMHKPEVITTAARRHGVAVPEHVWLERQYDETFDWNNVASVVKAGFKVSLQVTHPQDAPPEQFLRNEHVCIVWMVPSEYQLILEAADYIKYATRPGCGFETKVQRYEFNPRDYEYDQIWVE